MSQKYRRSDGKEIQRKNKIKGGRGIVDPDLPNTADLRKKTRWWALNQYVTDKVAEAKKLGLNDILAAEFAGISRA